MSRTAGAALLDALTAQGVSHLFANLGSDHPSIVEALAAARAAGRPVPRLLTCPNEMVAMSAAHGFWQATGEPQAVLVHVECGTQSLGGAVHNAAKGRAPIFVFAGASPYTQHGELPGSRNEFIQWIQDVHDQRGIVREYMRYAGEVRTGLNVEQLVARAFQFALSEPKGPVYLVGAREVMEGPALPEPPAARRAAVAPTALDPASLGALGRSLLDAKRPLVVSSYLGRNPAAVEPLVRLCRRLGIGVLDSVPAAVNFPHDDPLYQGSQWNEPVQNEALASADLVLVIDSDVPWIPLVSRPQAAARVVHIDVDPLKEQMPLWDIGAAVCHRATARTALEQLLAWLDGRAIDERGVAERAAHWHRLHANRARRLAAEARGCPDGRMTAGFFMSRLRAACGADTLFLNESISNYQAVFDHLRPSRPGSIVTSGGGSLGWSGGAAVGAKLARPDLTVVALAGDGSFMFSAPSPTFWMARRYDAPFLQVIFNNRGWRSPKLSTLALHPDGHAAHGGDFGTSFEPSPDYVGIAAAAGGAWGRQVRDPAEVDTAIAAALAAVREERRCAVLDILLDHH